MHGDMLRDQMRLRVNRGRLLWNGDLGTCVGRPQVPPIDPSGLPALPHPMLYPADGIIPVPHPEVAEECYVSVTFPSAPGGRDPLLEEEVESVRSWGRPWNEPKWSDYVHLRWVSSAWLCTEPRVIGAYLRTLPHPRTGLPFLGCGAVGPRLQLPP